MVVELIVDKDRRLKWLIVFPYLIIVVVLGVLFETLFHFFIFLNFTPHPDNPTSLITILVIKVKYERTEWSTGYLHSFDRNFNDKDRD